MESLTKTKIFLLILLVASLGLGGYFYSKSQQSPSTSINSSSKGKINRFASSQQFQKYISDSSQNSYYGFSPNIAGRQAAVIEDSKSTSGSTTSRYSQTNVQVQGVDEPDNVKNDGQNIFFSPNNYYNILPMIAERVDPGVSSPDINPNVIVETPKTKVISALPIDEIKINSTIKESGTLLRDDNILIILSNDSATAYNISIPTKPVKQWKITYTQKDNINTYYQDARLYNHKLYLITRSMISRNTPCPLTTSSNDKKETLQIDCTDIYYPDLEIDTSSTYNIQIINPTTGANEDSTSFMGSNNTSAIYMSAENLYITYYYPGNYFSFIYNSVMENKADYPADLIYKLTKVYSYDLTDSTKYSEISNILTQYRASLPESKQAKFDIKYENDVKIYFSKHMREFSKTGIVQISTKNLSVQNNVLVPGSLLNQFSLDEYDNTLRVATTVGESFSGNVEGDSATSFSDIYTFDKNLKQLGTLQNLGKNERIYSARFLENLAYIVTYRQTDPFYVIDLSDPTNPTLKGELKIPGYSSYLDPIDNNLVLGIGKEEDFLKISLFDVSDSSNPVEKDKYTFKDEYWSEALSTHHAFLSDPVHKIFFLPGSQNGYVFSYINGKITLTKTIDNIQALRALYINDYLYVIGQDKIVVINELNWKIEKTLKY